jgi:hypothetical protein
LRGPKPWSVRPGPNQEGRHLSSAQSLLAEAPRNRGVAAERRLLHNDESRPFQVLAKPLGDDPRHDFIGIMNALATLEAQREGERVG